MVSFPLQDCVTVRGLIKDRDEILKLIMLSEFQLFIAPQEGFKTQLYPSETFFCNHFNSCNKNQFNLTAVCFACFKLCRCQRFRGAYTAAKLHNTKIKLSCMCEWRRGDAAWRTARTVRRSSHGFWDSGQKIIEETRSELLHNCRESGKAI